MADLILDTDHQLRSMENAVKSLRSMIVEIKDLSLPDAASRAAAAIIRIRHARQNVQKCVDQIDELDRKFCHELIPSIFENEGNTSSVSVLGYRVTTTEAIKAQIIDKPGAFSWLESEGHGDLVDRDPRINAQTLNAFAKSIMMEGDLLPEHFFRIFQFSNTSISKAAK